MPSNWADLGAMPSVGGMDVAAIKERLMTRKAIVIISLIVAVILIVIIIALAVKVGALSSQVEQLGDMPATMVQAITGLWSAKKDDGQYRRARYRRAAGFNALTPGTPAPQMIVNASAGPGQNAGYTQVPSETSVLAMLNKAL